MRTTLFILFGISLCFSLHAQETQSDSLVRKATVTFDTIPYHGDTILVIETACAPICSSIARAYNKEMKPLGIFPPNPTMQLPEAYIEDNQLKWRDNYVLLLDEEGK